MIQTFKCKECGKSIRVDSAAGVKSEDFELCDECTPYEFKERPPAKSSTSVLQASVCQLCGHKLDGKKNASRGPDGKACTCLCHKGA